MTSRGAGLVAAAAGAILAQAPAQAQAIAAAQTAYLVVRPEVRVKNEEHVEGLWLRTTATVRQPSETWRADETSAGYAVSLQKEVLGHTWLGVSAYAQAPRFDMDRGMIRDARHYAGARLSFEASGNVEMGFAWLRRLRGRGFMSTPGSNRGIKPGPKAYMQVRF
ncbi:hypothetical protein P6144_04475 [Sphingomonas sp. HITSZ_GF]|uniref:hypothetical protein n=1 Tax=Sphingomonas sp. HITSZ_GF TaxID=3037247 RepID=UPI00240D7D0E|nr:hypothetical protein [Sphingomonas sp. HITSZ_GF]MDG2532890.1 hypothetical protein [Sphingomonas sp. HITSZ_GF]